MEDLIGMVSGHLKVVGFKGRVGKSYYWDCLCICGKVKTVNGCSIKRGDTKSCGCKRIELFKESRKTHGLSRDRIYDIWTTMISRCKKKSNASYDRYGARGISVCDKWLKFDGFRDDMYDSYLKKVKSTPNCQIDRIDSNGNYEKNNCRWVSPKENARNRKNIGQGRILTKDQVDEIRYNCDNKIKTQAYFSRKYDIDKTCISDIVLRKSYNNW